jgi:hypothetical protein
LLSSQIAEVEEVNAELRARIAKLESALKGRRTQIVGTRHAELGSGGAVDCSELCSTVLAAVSSLREENGKRGVHISDLGSAMKSVRSYVVGNDNGGSVECSVYVSNVSSTVSPLRDDNDNSNQRLRISELESSLKTIRKIIISEDGPKPVDCSIYLDDISSNITSFRDDHSRHGSRISELESAIRTIRLLTVGDDAEGLIDCSQDVSNI